MMYQQNLFDATEGRKQGELRKEAAHSLLCARRESFVMQARRALLQALLERGTATADDVRAVVAIPDDVSPKLFGSVPGGLAKAGIIEADGFVKTCRPAAHARHVTQWKLKDAEAAREWLRRHPEVNTAPTVAPVEAVS